MKKLAIFIMLFALSTHAEVYRWVDENGNTQFSDKPPAKTKAESIELKVPTSSYSGRDVQTRQRDTLESMVQHREEKQKASDKAEKQALRAEKFARRCIYLKDKLKRMNRAGRLYSLDKEGERVILDDDQRLENIQNLKANIEKNCD